MISSSPLPSGGSPAAAKSGTEALAREARVVESARILEGHTEVVINHNGRHYRLRCTRLGKLILTA